MRLGVCGWSLYKGAVVQECLWQQEELGGERRGRSSDISFWPAADRVRQASHQLTSSLNAL